MSQEDPGSQSLFESQKIQLVAALTGGVAHDFNNILTAVIGQIDLALMDRNLAPQVRESLTRALASARRGAELNTKLLQFSRQKSAPPGPASATSLVEETIFLVRRAIDRKVQILFEPPDEPVWPVWVDAGQSLHALMNLCLNARDAMPAGGQLMFELANRTFTTAEAQPPRRPGDFVRISVCDTGAGMKPEVLARLLETKAATSAAGEPARLVLSVAQQVVLAQGGWMEAESEPGRGNRFQVFLPRAVSSTVASGPPVVPGAGAGPGIEGKETILVVDDEQTVRAVLEAMLVFRGYKVLEAGDGVEAIERLRSRREPIDLVLLDIQMPRLNGWETMGQIHALRPKLPVLLLSGGNSDPPGGDDALARSAGVVGKPFASADLLRAVRQALDASLRNR